jgi:hypothetical protein
MMNKKTIVRSAKYHEADLLESEMVGEEKKGILIYKLRTPFKMANRAINKADVPDPVVA